MVQLKPGDKVSCKIKNNDIVSSSREYDEIKIFEVVAAGDYGLYLFVPEYFAIKGTLRIDKQRCNKYSIDTRFMGEQMINVNENMICTIVQQLDGMACSICHEFYPYAAPNQPDAQTLICWACRQNRFYR